MALYLLTFILAIATQKGEMQWLITEVYRRIVHLRSASVVMSQVKELCRQRFSRNSLDLHAVCPHNV